MPLLEREPHLRTLAAALADAAAGSGRVVFVGGEAGLGKTVLVEQFSREQAAGARVLWGACDALFTPRPLGPLHDAAGQLQGPLLAQLNAGADRPTLFAATLAELTRTLTLFTIEDAHWADDATLDLIKFLGRRIQRTRLLLIVTYRDDEVGRQHPLATVLGDLATTAAARRVSLSPLSEAAVRALVGDRPLEPAALRQQTGGNPFFVTEIIANEAGGLPATVRDAVLARALRLGPAARAVLEAAAVIGARAEAWLLAAVSGPDTPADAIDQALAAGMLVSHGHFLGFRHELARQAVLATLSPLRQMALHRQALAALRAAPDARPDLARLAHHAAAAGDGPAVLEYAPLAAQQAAQANAFRQAAALYQLAVRYAGDLPLAQRAVLLEGVARFCDVIDQRAEALAARREAAALWRQAGHPLNEGVNHAFQVVMLIGMGRNAEAEAASQAAVALFETQTSARHLALGYSTQASLRLFAGDYAAVEPWCEKMLALPGIEQHFMMYMTAQLTRATAGLHLDYARGRAELERVLADYEQAGAVIEAANALANWGTHALQVRQLRDADRCLAQGLAASTDRDIDILRLVIRAAQVRLYVWVGRWDEAGEAAAEVLQRPGASAISRQMALEGLGRLRARRGDPGIASALDEALALASQAGSLPPLGAVRAARAEAAWLAGEPARALAEAQAVYDLAVQKQHPWLAGELAYWRWRCGQRVTVPTWAAEPYALQVRGDWRAAAAAWEALGCPYEQACALAEGDPPAQAAALRVFAQLGARPAAERLRQHLLSQGAFIPRGPRAATRHNPYGLTSRQVDILRLVADGLTNREIAARLHLSAKTVEHHVSAVLAKLDVPTRAAAARLARQDPGLAPPTK